jgi:hypothetical protein
MKIKNILLIASIVIVIFGVSIIFIPTDMGMTLVGVILFAVGVLLFFTYLVYNGPPK